KVGFKASPLTKENESFDKTVNFGGYGLIVLSGLMIATGFIGSLIGLANFWSTLFYAVAIVVSGVKPVKSAYFAVKSKSLDMNVLISSAAIGAAIIGEWFEGATVVWLFALGTVLQKRSMEKTRTSITNLMDLAPSEAWVKKDTGLIKVPLKDIAIGSVVIINP